MRNFLVPAVQISPQIAMILIFAGLFLRLTGLLWAGILFYGLVVIFMILTLPVEFDASRRGLKLLSDSGLMVAPEDTSGSRNVLTAAALTYVAAAVTAVLNLLYYISLANRRR
jgi:Zn-dependent membrane protease YugP